MHPIRNVVLFIAAGLVAQMSVGAADIPQLLSAMEVKWGAPPPALPPGAKFAVISGDPAASGLVTVRLDMPAGYVIPPHFHPTDEHVTVLKGTFSLGMGDLVDKAHAVTLSSGGDARRNRKYASLRLHHDRRHRAGALARAVCNHLREPC